MKKNTPQKQTVADFVQAIDNELNSREAELLAIKEDLELMRDRVAADRLSVENDRVSLETDKAEFALLKSEVDQKFAKIRQDQELSEALREQANERKALEALAKEAQEDRLLSEINIKEVQKRELALSDREKKYKEEVEKQFVSGFFKA